jgi:flagellin-like hook-associated protein FlgL
MAIADISLTEGMRRNLVNMQGTTALLARTQDRLSTGKRVNTALDDPTNFFAAQGHMQRAGDLAARKDAMLEAIQTAKASDAAITAISSLIDQAKSVATSALASTDTATRASYGSQWNTLMSQVVKLAQDSGYKGVNLLSDSTLNVKFNESGSSSIDVNGFQATTLQYLSLNFINGTTTAGTGSVGSIGSWTVSNNDALNTAIAMINTATDNLRSQSKALATNLNIVTVRNDFTKNMIDTLKAGADNLTLADMNEEGANMLMLQTRQSLGTTSLSLASQAAQSILRLF